MICSLLPKDSLCKEEGIVSSVPYGAPVVEGKPVGEAGSDDSPFHPLLHLQQGQKLKNKRMNNPVQVSKIKCLPVTP